MTRTIAFVTLCLALCVGCKDKASSEGSARPAAPEAPTEAARPSVESMPSAAQAEQVTTERTVAPSSTKTPAPAAPQPSTSPNAPTPPATGQPAAPSTPSGGVAAAERERLEAAFQGLFCMVKARQQSKQAVMLEKLGFADPAAFTAAWAKAEALAPQWAEELTTRTMGIDCAAKLKSL